LVDNTEKTKTMPSELIIICHRGHNFAATLTYLTHVQEASILTQEKEWVLY